MRINAVMVHNRLHFLFIATHMSTKSSTIERKILKLDIVDSSSCPQIRKSLFLTIKEKIVEGFCLSFLQVYKDEYVWVSRNP